MNVPLHVLKTAFSKHVQKIKGENDPGAWEIEQNEIWKIWDQIWKALTLYFPKISKFPTLEKLLHSRKFRRKSENFQNRDFWEVFDQIWGVESEFRSFRGVWGFLRSIRVFDNIFWHFRPLLGVSRPWWVWDHYRPNSGRRMSGYQNFQRFFGNLSYNLNIVWITF